MPKTAALQVYISDLSAIIRARSNVGFKHLKSVCIYLYCPTKRSVDICMLHFKSKKTLLSLSRGRSEYLSWRKYKKEIGMLCVGTAVLTNAQVCESGNVCY